MKLLMSKDLQFYCSSFRAGPNKLDGVGKDNIPQSQKWRAIWVFHCKEPPEICRKESQRLFLCLLLPRGSYNTFFFFFFLRTLFIEFKLDYLSVTWFDFMHMYNLKFNLVFHLTIHSCCLNLCFFMIYKKAADMVCLRLLGISASYWLYGLLIFS